MLTKKRPVEMITALESSEVESVMTGQENQSDISYVRSSTPGLFSIKMISIKFKIKFLCCCVAQNAGYKIYYENENSVDEHTCLMS